MSMKYFGKDNSRILYYQLSIGYSAEKLVKSRFSCFGLFELESAFVFPSTITDVINKVVKDVYEKIWRKKNSRIISKKSIDYSTRKIINLVFLVWGSFDLENVHVCLLKPSGSIKKVVMNFHKNVLQISTRILYRQNPWTITHKNLYYNGFSYFLGSFKVVNAPIFPLGRTSTVTKVLTDINEKFW